jgi:hypothetical protein
MRISTKPFVLNILMGKHEKKEESYWPYGYR